jgi:hypothetical protein
LCGVLRACPSQHHGWQWLSTDGWMKFVTQSEQSQSNIIQPIIILNYHICQVAARNDPEAALTDTALPSDIPLSSLDAAE